MTVAGMTVAGMTVAGMTVAGTTVKIVMWTRNCLLFLFMLEIYLTTPVGRI